MASEQAFSGVATVIFVVVTVMFTVVNDAVAAPTVHFATELHRVRLTFAADSRKICICLKYKEKWLCGDF